MKIKKKIHFQYDYFDYGENTLINFVEHNLRLSITKSNEKKTYNL